MQVESVKECSETNSYNFKSASQVVLVLSLSERGEDTERGLKISWRGKAMESKAPAQADRNCLLLMDSGPPTG